MVKNIVMLKVNVFEIKAKLSEYIDRAVKGERIVICRHNRPVAELRAIQEVRSEARPIGPLPGRPTFAVPATFFEPLTDKELDLWERGTPLMRAGRRTHDNNRPPKVAEHKASYRRAGANRARKHR
jgi:prevent-host-death family protein